MQRKSDQRDHQSPEKLIIGLVARLRHHVLWDAVAVFLPPVFVAIYLTAYLYHSAWISQTTLWLSSVAAAGVLLVGTFMRVRRRPLAPFVRSAARWVDERAGANDRFITLATLEPSTCSPALFSRVRREAAGFVDRINLKREFPYKMKRSFYHSLVISVLAGIVLQLFLPNVQSNIRPVPLLDRVREVAQKMMQRPRLHELARDLQKVATRLEDPKSSQDEKRMIVAEVRKKIDEQNNKPQEREDRDLLGQASSTLKSLDPQSGNRQDSQKNQDQGDGGIQGNLPQEGQGEGTQRPGSGGDSKGDLNAQLNKDIQQGRSAPGDPQEQGNQKNPQSKGDEKNKAADSNGPGKTESKEIGGKTKGRSEETGGKNKGSEEAPLGAPPAERFYQAGEKGKEGIKDARYVTVQLPEEISGDFKGHMTSAKARESSKNRPKTPLSNVPLPAQVPDAPTETQQMPLEYRGMIR